MLESKINYTHRSGSKQKKRDFFSSPTHESEITELHETKENRKSAISTNTQNRKRRDLHHKIRKAPK